MTSAFLTRFKKTKLLFSSLENKSFKFGLRCILIWWKPDPLEKSCYQYQNMLVKYHLTSVLHIVIGTAYKIVRYAIQMNFIPHNSLSFSNNLFSEDNQPALNRPPSFSFTELLFSIGFCFEAQIKIKKNAKGEDRTHDLEIMRLTRCQLRYFRQLSHESLDSQTKLFFDIFNSLFISFIFQQLHNR